MAPKHWELTFPEQAISILQAVGKTLIGRILACGWGWGLGMGMGAAGPVLCSVSRAQQEAGGVYSVCPLSA